MGLQLLNSLLSKIKNQDECRYLSAGAGRSSLYQSWTEQLLPPIRAIKAAESQRRVAALALIKLQYWHKGPAAWLGRCRQSVTKLLTNCVPIFHMSKQQLALSCNQFLGRRAFLGAVENQGRPRRRCCQQG